MGAASEGVGAQGTGRRLGMSWFRVQNRRRGVPGSLPGDEAHRGRWWLRVGRYDPGTRYTVHPCLDGSIQGPWPCFLPTRPWPSCSRGGGGGETFAFARMQGQAPGCAANGGALMRGVRQSKGVPMQGLAPGSDSQVPPAPGGAGRWSGRGLGPTGSRGRGPVPRRRQLRPRRSC